LTYIPILSFISDLELNKVLDINFYIAAEANLKQIQKLSKTKKN